MTYCTRCKQNKTPDDFYWRRDGSRRISWCKACQIGKMQAWRAANPEKAKAVSRQYYLNSKRRKYAAAKAGD